MNQNKREGSREEHTSDYTGSPFLKDYI